LRSGGKASNSKGGFVNGRENAFEIYDLRFTTKIVEVGF
jgi:hypothetical protein